MSNRDVVEWIRLANAGRDPRLLLRKYEKMSADPFAFLRGSCHLFYQEWEGSGALDATPRSWISGDLHLENFGCIAAGGAALRFDVNDYDECRLAPVAWDLTRFVTSLHLAAGSRVAGAKPIKGRKRLAKAFLGAYAAALKKGQLQLIDRRAASAPVRDVLADAAALTLERLLQQRTTPAEGGGRRLAIDGKKTLALRSRDRATVESCWRAFRKRYPGEGRLRLVDAARRISGTGSLGIGRFVLLVAANGAPHRDRLLDLKRMRPVTPVTGVRVRQPRWRSEAERVAEVNRRVQGPLGHPLWPIAAAGGAWLIRSLQPSDQRFELETALRRGQPLGPIVKDMGRTLAAAQLRAAGWRSADPVEDLRAFAADRSWQAPVLAYAEAYARTVEADHRQFVMALRLGALDP